MSTELTELSTDTVFAARDHARAQDGRQVEAMPYLPASSSPYVPDGVDPEDLVWAETITSGGYTHKRIARGTRIRLEDVDGDACAHVLLFNAWEPWERLNVADTMKIPWQAYLGGGHPLLSGDGRVLATIMTDTSGRHDGFCGYLSDLANDAKYGVHEVQSAAPSGQALMRLAGVKHGLTLRDLPPSVSFFQGVRVREDGSFEWLGTSGAGAAVELVAEMPLVVLIANSPHPLDPRATYPTGLLRIHAWRSEPTLPTDPQWSRTPELRRAYLNTADYLAPQGV